MSGSFYFVRYWAIRVLQLFVNLVVMSWILKLTLSFQSSRFLYLAKKSWLKLKLLESEKSCLMVQSSKWDGCWKEMMKYVAKNRKSIGSGKKSNFRNISHLCRDSRSLLFFKTGFLKNFSKIIKMHFSSNVIKSVNLTKKQLWQKCFPVTLPKFWQNSFELVQILPSGNLK